MQKVAIVGAGICGLYLAKLLENKFDISLYEARDRIGGRVYSQNGHDLGPSWIWPHQTRVLELLQELNLEIFPQYTKGNAVYQASTIQYFTAPPQPESYRVKGGMQALAQGLKKQLKNTYIEFNSELQEIVDKGDKIVLKFHHKEVLVDKIIITFAPRLVSNISFSPPLQQNIVNQFKNIPTWMGYIIKVVVTYNEAFWREKGLSGFAFSNTGVLGEIHDATTEEEGALFGFASAKKEDLINEKNIIDQLAAIFGDEARNYKKIFIMNWNKEIYSATQEDLERLHTHPEYGYDFTAMGHKVFFASTESSYENGGYIEGALAAAEKIAENI